MVFVVGRDLLLMMPYCSRLQKILLSRVNYFVYFHYQNTVPPHVYIKVLVPEV